MIYLLWLCVFILTIKLNTWTLHCSWLRLFDFNLLHCFYYAEFQNYGMTKYTYSYTEDNHEWKELRTISHLFHWGLLQWHNLLKMKCKYKNSTYCTSHQPPKTRERERERRTLTRWCCWRHLTKAFRKKPIQCSSIIWPLSAQCHFVWTQNTAQLLF